MKAVFRRLSALLQGVSPAEMAAAVVLLLVSAVMISQLPDESRMLDLKATIGGADSSSYWCGDNACNRANGENSLNCIIDCPLEHCGDLTCQAEEGETMETCPNDCGWCGDGTCQNNEDATSCNEDCGYCGDDICGAFETPQSCEDDCDDDLCEGVVCPRINECYFPGECDPRTGQCINRTQPDGTDCNADSNLCTQGDSCMGGSCVAGPEKVCDESPACHNPKICRISTGICYEPGPAIANGTSCDDDNPCTITDKCNGGSCAGVPENCNDDNRCTTDSCNPATGCINTPNTNDSTCGCVNGCDDNNPCTTDSCENNACRNIPLGGDTGCPDSNVCNGEEVCRAGVCAPADDPMDCDDDNPCTADSCSVEAGGCRNVLIPRCRDCRYDSDCSDGNVCTSDICNEAGECSNPPDNAASCDDGKFCTGIESCRNGVCNHGAPPICVVSPEDQRNPCKAPPATCDAAEDWCKTPNKVDNTRCIVPGTVTVGACRSGTCRPLECPNDPGLCEKPGTGVYNAATDRCTYQPDTGTSCDDENICTGNGRCTAEKTCAPGPMINCTDNNECTSDICNIFTGCVHRPVQSPRCSNVCRPANCDDSNPCTSPDVCNGTTCSNPPVPDGEVCGDDNPSTPDGVCRAGVCGPALCTSILACIDDDPCTDDSCNAGICENAFRWNDLSCLLRSYFGNRQQQAAPAGATGNTPSVTAPVQVRPSTAPTPKERQVAPASVHESAEEEADLDTSPAPVDPPAGCTETDQSFCSFIGKTCETIDVAPYFHCVSAPEESPPEPACPEHSCDSLREQFCRTMRGGAHCVEIDRQPCYECRGSNEVEEEESSEESASSEDEKPDNCAEGGNLFCLRMQKYCESIDELPGIRCY